MTEYRDWTENPNTDYQFMAEVLAKAYAFHATPGLRIPTGWESIDPYLHGGPAPGEVVYILGRSHTGKSMFLLNIMHNNRDTPVVLFTLEMPLHQAVTRLTAMAMNTSDDIVMRNLEHSQWQAGENPLLARPHFIIDTPTLSLRDMGHTIERMRSQFMEDLWPRLVLIDYLELVRSPGRESGYERAETLARELKAWSKSYEMPVVVAHQSNMTLKRWEQPDEGSARGAGYTEADAVIGIWHPASDPKVRSGPEAERVYKARLIKNRIGGRLSEELDFQLDNALLLWDPIQVARLRLDVM